MPYSVYIYKFKEELPIDIKSEIILNVLKEENASYTLGEEYIKLSDGSFVESWADDLYEKDYVEGISFIFRGGFTMEFVNLAYKIANAIEGSIINDAGEIGSMDNPFMLLTNEQQRENLPTAFSEGAVMCTSVDFLNAALNGGLTRWLNWPLYKHPEQVAP